MPHIPWELLLKTSSLAEMKRTDTAKQYAHQIRERFPDLQSRLKEYVGAFLQDEKLVTRIYLDLQKSGLE